MLRFIVRSLLLLILVNGLLLYMHYNEAGNATVPSETQSTYVQEIEVTNRSDALYVQHHFTGLSDARHEIVWPEESIERSCYMEDRSLCSRLNEEATAFVEGDAGRQSIMYVIPKAEPMHHAVLFENIFATVDHSWANSTLFHMTDEMKLGGLWVNGLELIGNQKMDLVDYSLFRGKGALTDLYWQEKEQPLAYQGERLTVFGSGVDATILKEADVALAKVELPYSTIVLTSTESPIYSNRFAILHPKDFEKGADTFLINSLSDRLLLSEDNPVLAEVIASLFSEKAVGTEKSRKMYEMLNQHLKESERSELIELLHDFEGKQVDAATLDGLLNEVTGFATSFFEKNKQSAKIYPFLLEDPRTVYLESEENSEIAVILKDGKTLYPITPIMRQLGYEISSNEQSLYIENEARKFRFPMKELFYVYNERRYNVKSMPFVQIEDEFYFEEAALIRIFLISIEKTSERIDMSPIAIFGKEGDA